MTPNKYADWQSPIDCYDQIPEHGLIDWLPVITIFSTAIFSICANQTWQGEPMAAWILKDTVLETSLVVPGKAPLAHRLFSINGHR